MQSEKLEARMFIFTRWERSKDHPWSLTPWMSSVVFHHISEYNASLDAPTELGRGAEGSRRPELWTQIDLSLNNWIWPYEQLRTSEDVPNLSCEFPSKLKINWNNYVFRLWKGKWNWSWFKWMIHDSQIPKPTTKLSLACAKGKTK